ncbi:MAG: rhodanese-like domain-containing protein [Rhodocyclaceae bacterium]|nr:rhodanese-like domain-containing protein [Rhodocyclaceae bacterium]
MPTIAKRLSCLCLCLISAAVAQAGGKPETPATLPGGTVISVEEGLRLLQAGSATFIDTRNPLNFGKGHVPGARAVAYREKSAYAVDFDASVDHFALDRLPGDTSAPLVFYSDGPTGWKSYKAAMMAIRHGYGKVNYMRGGWADWRAADLPVER